MKILQPVGFLWIFLQNMIYIPVMKLFFLKRKTNRRLQGTGMNRRFFPSQTGVFFSVFLSACFLVSCINPLDKEVTQSLRGMVFPVSSVLSLKCVLTTGQPDTTRPVNWTDAVKVNLEKRISKGKYDPVPEGGTVSYKGYQKTEQGLAPVKGYINYFPYVSVESVRNFQSSENSGSGYALFDESRVARAKGRLTCENLIPKEDIPFLIAKPNHSYIARFQLMGKKLRVLLEAPPEDLPSHSLPYSFKLPGSEGKERYAMPIGGYTVRLGHIEQRENADLELTNILIFRDAPIERLKRYESQSEDGIRSVYRRYRAGSDRADVDHISFASANFHPFATLAEKGEKKDVYPKSLLSGDWYYESTVVSDNVSSRSAAAPGLPFAVDNNFWQSNKIRIYFQSNHLVAVTLNTEEAEPLKNPATHTTRWVFKIPVTHLDYRSEKLLGRWDSGLKEIRDDTKSREKKNYARINFENIKLGAGSLGPGYQLSELTVSENYLSFVLKSNVDTHKIRFSLLRPVPLEERTYIPLTLTRAFDDFPVFHSKRRVDIKDRVIRSEKFSDSLTAQRFDLNNPIVYRFSSYTPKNDRIRDIGRETVSLWAQIYEKAGVSCPGGPCVILDEESGDVELGDIRYNVLNLIAPENFVGLNPFAGLGPSVADFETGEIISATANVYLDNIYIHTLNSIYSYIQSRSGLIRPFTERMIIQPLSSPLGTGKWMENILLPKFFMSWNGKEKRYSLESLDLSDPGGIADPSVIGQAMKEWIPLSHFLSRPGSAGNSFEENLTAFFLGENPPAGELNDPGLKSKGDHINPDSSAPCALNAQGFLPSLFIYRLIDTVCGEKLTLLKEITEHPSLLQSSPHIKRDWLWKKSGDTSYEEEIHRCASEILLLAGLGVSLHEVGHNMSMMHNFSASTDKDNFLPVREFQFKYVFKDSQLKEKIYNLYPEEGITSSVMDYMPSGRRIFPGGYDTAFIRFLYGGERETKLGAIVKAEVNDEGRLKYVTESGETVPKRKLRKYRNCDDYSYRAGGDIYCNLFDEGAGPDEIVSHYQKIYIRDGFDLKGSAIRPSHGFSTAWGVIQFFVSTYKIYHKWRLEFSKSGALSASRGDLYLNDVTVEEYQSAVERALCEENESAVSEVTNSDDSSHNHSDLRHGLCGRRGVKNPRLAGLYKAKRIISETLHTVLFASDHYCLAQNFEKDGLTELIPLSEIKTAVRESHLSNVKRLTEISSCQDVSRVFALMGRDLIGEAGVPLFPGVFSTEQNQEADFSRLLLNGRFDYSGSFAARLLAGWLLMAQSKSPILEGHRPLSLINDPDIRAALSQEVISRLTKGVYIGHRTLPNGESKPIIFPDFSSEEILWKAVSFPLLVNSNHWTNYTDLFNSLKDFTIIIVPQPFVDLTRKTFANTTRLGVYLDTLNAGGYLPNESKELYNGNRESGLIAFSKGQNPYTRSLLDSLFAVDLRKSFVKFTSRILSENNDESGDESAVTTFSDLKNKIDGYLKSVKDALIILFSDPSPEVNVLTHALLYDYLEAGERTLEDLPPSPDLPYEILPSQNEGFITNALVEQLQVARTLHFKLSRAFTEKCAELSLTDCPNPYFIKKNNPEFDKLVREEKDRLRSLPAEDYEDSIFAGDKEHHIPNIFTPYLKELREQGVPSSASFEEKNAFFDLVYDLYLMELFKADYYADSLSRRDLKDLYVTQWGQALSRLSDEKRDSSKNRMSAVKRSIKKLRTLSRHRNSKYLQEIFVRRMYRSTQSFHFKYIVDFLEDAVIVDANSGSFFSVRLEKTWPKAQNLFQPQNRKVMREFHENLEPKLAGLLQVIKKKIGFLPEPGRPPNLSGIDPLISFSLLPENAPLYEVVNNRMLRELESQRNTVLSAVNPFIILEPGSGGINLSR